MELFLGNLHLINKSNYLWQISEEHLEFSRTSTMGLFRGKKKKMYH